MTVVEEEEAEVVAEVVVSAMPTNAVNATEDLLADSRINCPEILS